MTLNSPLFMGYVTMFNADGIHRYIGNGRWEINAPDSSEELLMTVDEFLNDPALSNDAIDQSRADSFEYGIHRLQWHSVAF